MKWVMEREEIDPHDKSTKRIYDRSEEILWVYAFTFTDSLGDYPATSNSLGAHGCFTAKPLWTRHHSVLIRVRKTTYLIFYSEISKRAEHGLWSNQGAAARYECPSKY